MDSSINSLPSYDGSAFPCMYSGYQDSNDVGTHHLFYWMYKTQDPNNTAPVIVWINGGPGSSSMFGNFLENGPLKITENATATDDDLYKFSVIDNPQGSWADAANLIYIDQPIGTGFSYSDPPEYLTEMSELADEFVNFMANLYNAYPELQGRPLWMTGESYAGKYLPVFSNALLDSDANSYYNVTFNLNGTMVGNPYTAPLTQKTSRYEIPYALNVIDDSDLPQVDALIRRC